MGEDENLRVLVLKLLHAHHLDATSVLALEELLDYLKEKTAMSSSAKSARIAQNLEKFRGALQNKQENALSSHCRQPHSLTAKAIKRAKYLISGEQAKVTIYAERNQG